MKIRPLLLAAVSLALLTSGCSTLSNKISEFRAKPAETLEPSTSTVVVLYHVHLGSDDEDFTDHNVYLNGNKVGRLNAGEELRIQVSLGISELNIRPELRWLGTTRYDAVKYSLQITKDASTRYLRYRTAAGEGRYTPVAGQVLADRELVPVTELEYNTRN
ncbi:hypothetical protein AACH06_00305 [Ideonella sp. DXS29W]|uniref:DUF2846 domain-containing protein n=1 Tax=Ideonella lacteola TaxID=2984193 RepID=A0ABU9BH12_9BURK